MSHDAREWVWDHSHSKGTARMVLALIADRCRDRQCVAYASVRTLMKRANASRTAVRDALTNLIASGELMQLTDRKGPRGETYYCLPVAARFLAERADGGGPESGPPEGPDSDPRGVGIRPCRTLRGGVGIRPRGTESGPQGGQIPTRRGCGFRPPEQKRTEGER